MQTYKNTTETSCVYDAFYRAGLPVDESMKHGWTGYKVLDFLAEHGFRIYRKGETATINSACLVIRNWGEDKYQHIEYHESFMTVLDLESSTIGAVAIKEKTS